MEQITITRGEFRDRATKQGVKQLKENQKNPNISPMGLLAMSMMHASICAALELELFGEETKED